MMYIKNNIFSNAGKSSGVNTGGAAYGLNFTNAGNPADPDWDGNAYWSNKSGDMNLMNDTTTNKINSVAPYTPTYDVCTSGCANNTLSVDPWTSSTTLDYSLNSTAGGGAALRGTAFYRNFSFSALLGTSTPDFGPFQHSDPVSTGGGGTATVNGWGLISL